LSVPLSLENVLPSVRELAVEQGRLAVSRWSSAVPLEHKDRRDFTTAVDLEIEHNIKSRLRELFPDHGLSGEETADENPDSEYQWLIDPIDGTKYYAGQSSLFSVSIGLLLRGEPILGVVYNAPASQCFYAVRGGGAFLDGRQLHGSSAEDLSTTIATLDTSGTDDLTVEEQAWFERKLLELTRQLYRARALGQGSLSACWLASGAFDAYLDLTGKAKPQDLAAGRVLMKEAGCRVEYLDPGVGPPRLLAAPAKVFAQLERLLLE
jgi:myo-inositol-1(or 4)-monophosphatase